MRQLLLLTAAAIALVGGARSATAHEVRPGFLELREGEPGVYRVVWKKPARGNYYLRLEPVFPESCTYEELGRLQPDAGSVIANGSLTCLGELAGQELRVAGLAETITDVLVRVYYESGNDETHLLRPNAESVTLSGSSSAGDRAAAYVRIGVEHILLGVDHLLFVLGLLLIVGNRWMLVKTITSFTVAHSITLAIATLGYVSAPVPPLNAAIALSILFLGPEIVRARRGGASITIRHPWLVAFAFGLLHGFGFASGLTSMGIPEGEIPLALLLFNVGVEVGQIAFVLLIVLLERSFRTLAIRWPRWVEAMPAYAIGTLGAFWTIQRTMIMLGGLR